MASNAGGFRYPVGGDTPDIPRDIKNLADDVNSYALLKTGGTATGAISVPTPTTSNHAATKAYVDKNQRPVAFRVNPTAFSWTTATNVKRWSYPFTAPFLSGNWIIQASWNCDFVFTGAVTFTLATMAYNSDSSYRTFNYAQLPSGASMTNNGTGEPNNSVSLMATDIIPANTGVSIKLETNSSIAGYYTSTGSVYRQTLNVLAWPTLQTSIGTWPAAT
jgi:hypothetical protein